MAELISGKLVSSWKREQIKAQVEELREKHGAVPGLAVILVGSDPASSVYVRNKHRACAEVGIRSIEILMPEETTEAELLEKIRELNDDPAVNGILVQLPLPGHISEEKVINSISAAKDVDAFHPENVGRIVTGGYKFLPCTPAGIITLLDYYKIDVTGKRCVVVGRSNIVGKPMALLLLERNGTVTVCHSRTKNLTDITREADILVVAIGRPNFLGKDAIKPGAVVIDVGINRLPDGSLAGDVDFASAEQVASYITPVPGGVGPMTITTLLQNTVNAFLETV
ncbi:MAG: bifunctional methylenetetrahydrofolate dehydrogenase/methenyltetrahydrofolate cyclohydrolase FolD [Clostridia bacterium]|nr:bifunctional methylenetetrahydrofolate dehydrogenase/methenyltetrahydrofolate cyclohydrolase FolD [Clostridia bacterium]